MTDPDTLETRTAQERSEALAEALPHQVARAQALEGFEALRDIPAEGITDREALAGLPVLRKSKKSMF